MTTKRLRFSTLVKNLPPELVKKAEELRKAKVPVYKIAEALCQEQTLTKTEDLSTDSSNCNESLSLPNPFVNYPIPTRANSNHSYWQYIHPVKLGNTIEDFEYAFFIVNKEGIQCRSNNYSDRVKCHEDLKAYLEENASIELIALEG